jgi:hypothetical protein
MSIAVVGSRRVGNCGILIIVVRPSSGIIPEIWTTGAGVLIGFTGAETSSVSSDNCLRLPLLLVAKPLG